VQSASFSTLVTLTCVGGFLVVNALAGYWVTANERETAVLNDIQVHFPTFPLGGILILDGVCPYVGPAIVFESSWDLAGALITLYGDPTLQADVVGPDLAINDHSIVTSLYGIRYSYPYSDHLIVYDFTSKAAHHLIDATAARTYFNSISPDRNRRCGPAEDGYGQPVFPWQPLSPRYGFG